MMMVLVAGVVVDGVVAADVAEAVAENDDVDDDIRVDKRDDFGCSAWRAIAALLEVVTVAASIAVERWCQTSWTPWAAVEIGGS
jgi:hypothetical protein